MIYYFFDTEYNLEFKVDKYANNNSLAVRAIDTEEGCPFCFVTVNLPESSRCKENEAFIDVNNTGELIEVMEENGYVEDTFDFAISGFCTYPKYRFTEKFFKEVA